jgi:hypothetical protein
MRAADQNVRMVVVEQAFDVLRRLRRIGRVVAADHCNGAPAQPGVVLLQR